MQSQIQTSKKKTGVIAPKRFVQRLKRDNEAFRSYMHQARACVRACVRVCVCVCVCARVCVRPQF